VKRDPVRTKARKVRTSFVVDVDDVLLSFGLFSWELPRAVVVVVVVMELLWGGISFCWDDISVDDGVSVLLRMGREESLSSCG